MRRRWRDALAALQRQSISFSDASLGRTSSSSYALDTSRGPVQAACLVVACGGLSIPKIGASDLGYRIARQFELPVIAPRPALVPLTFDAAAWAPFAELAGLALPVHIETGGKKTAPALPKTCCSPIGV